MNVVNVGCSTSTIDGAVNIDNSFSVFLGNHKIILRILSPFLRLTEDNKNLIRKTISDGIVCGKATKLPLSDGSMDVVYSSHMLEHLNYEDAKKFLSESYRVLKMGGVALSTS